MTHTHKIVKAMYTWAIPGFWYELSDGTKEFSTFGEELTREQKEIVHSFPCNVFKNI